MSQGIPATASPIAPAGLASGHLAHGLSWVALAVLASRGTLSLSFPGLAWVHLVTLGWLTLVSLTVLVHVLEELFDLRWPGGRAVHAVLVAYALGVTGLVAGFWLSLPTLLAWSAVGVAACLAAYLALSVGAFASFVPAPGRSVRALRAFQLVLLLLAATAALGVGMAWTLGFGGSGWWLARGPALHAHLGGLGWLSLLVVGVAQRTLRALFGRGSERVLFHVVALSCRLLALAPLTVGLLGGPGGALWVGLGLATLGVLAHAVDVVRIARTAKVTHRPPQAFVLAATAWLVVAAALGAGVLAGRPWHATYAFATLVGWVGQMVNGHLHHLPVVALGRRFGVAIGSPGDWLSPALSWAAFVGFQLAVGLGVAGGVGGQPGWVLVGAVSGAVAWVLMTANVSRAAVAVSRSRVTASIDS